MSYWLVDLVHGWNPRIEELAKPLLTLSGKPVITYIVERIPENIEIIVTTNRKFESAFLEWQKGLKRSVELFVEDAVRNNEKLGALRSIDYLIEQKELEEDLLIIGGDNYFSLDLSKFIDTYSGSDPLIAAFNIKDKDKAKNFGVVTVKEGQAVAFCEKPLHPVTSLVAVALYILPPRVLKFLSECCVSMKDNLGDFIAFLINNKHQRVNVYVFEGTWFDIGTAESLREAKDVVERQTLSREANLSERKER